MSAAAGRSGQNRAESYPGLPESFAIPLVVFLLSLALPWDKTAGPEFYQTQTDGKLFYSRAAPESEPCFKLEIRDVVRGRSITEKTQVPGWLGERRDADPKLDAAMHSYDHFTYRPPFLGGRTTWAVEIVLSPVEPSTALRARQVLGHRLAHGSVRL